MEQILALQEQALAAHPADPPAELLARWRMQVLKQLIQQRSLETHIATLQQQAAKTVGAPLAPLPLSFPFAPGRDDFDVHAVSSCRLLNMPARYNDSNWSYSSASTVWPSAMLAPCSRTARTRCGAGSPRPTPLPESDPPLFLPDPGSTATAGGVGYGHCADSISDPGVRPSHCRRCHHKGPRCTVGGLCCRFESPISANQHETPLTPCRPLRSSMEDLGNDTCAKMRNAMSAVCLGAGNLCTARSHHSLIPPPTSHPPPTTNAACASGQAAVLCNGPCPCRHGHGGAAPAASRHQRGEVCHFLLFAPPASSPPP